MKNSSMKVLIVLCLVAGAFASCPANSHYESCGTACPLTCDNYQDPPIFCIRMCNPGCHCDEGYVKTKDGNCVKPEQCPVADDDDDDDNFGTSCTEPAETGFCRAYFPLWYYDVESGTCKEFIYGGCGGNGNRYVTEEQCLQKCSGVKQSSSNALCELPSETGRCFGYFPRFHFDSSSGECKEFIYGGCGGNGNNFRTIEECRNTCGNSRASSTCGANERYTSCGTSCPLTCRNFQNPPRICNLMCNVGCECIEGYVRSADGRCVKPENCPAKALDRPDCDKGPETGVCDAYFPRFYYDQEAGMCKRFTYGGCGGNRNNFRTEAECYNRCGALASSGSNDACQQEKEVGPCKALVLKYFFNKETSKCQMFVYGGCKGNANNFATLDECEKTCSA